MSDLSANDLPVNTKHNADCDMSVVVTSWLTLYPNARFRGQIRRSLGDPVVLYEWREDPADSNGLIRVVTAGSEKLLLMKMPARHAKNIGPISGWYDVLIEDPVIDMKRPAFGGNFNITYGVTA